MIEIAVVSIVVLALYIMSKRTNMMRMAIGIAMLNYPAMIIFAEFGNEALALSVVAIESATLAVVLLLARYVWRFEGTEEVGSK
jgi:multisubunit Na+/H+ antiporter MnhC subunit